MISKFLQYWFYHIKNGSYNIIGHYYVIGCYSIPVLGKTFRDSKIMESRSGPNHSTAQLEFSREAEQAWSVANSVLSPCPFP